MDGVEINMKYAQLGLAMEGTDAAEQSVRSWYANCWQPSHSMERHTSCLQPATDRTGALFSSSSWLRLCVCPWSASVNVRQSACPPALVARLLRIHCQELAKMPAGHLAAIHEQVVIVDTPVTTVTLFGGAKKTIFTSLPSSSRVAMGKACVAAFITVSHCFFVTPARTFLPSSCSTTLRRRP